MLILASSSPRRQQLLSLMGVDFQVFTSEIDESVTPGEAPENYVLRLALKKSRSISAISAARQVVIAADTAVVNGNQILGKPDNSQEAINMLCELRARCHQVFTGLVVRDTANEEVFTDLCVTDVYMRSYRDPEIKEYVASGDPLDKAGAYAIQNSGFNPVDKISGCYSNVVGLPLCHLNELLHQMGVKFHEAATRGCRSSQGYNCQLVDKIQGYSAP